MNGQVIDVGVFKLIDPDTTSESYGSCKNFSIFMNVIGFCDKFVLELFKLLFSH